MTRAICILLIGFSQVGCSMFGFRREENPKYQVVQQEGAKEIREYAGYIEATTTAAGDFKDAQNAAFRILAAYIFGENERQTKISMTAPVLQAPNTDAPGEKIAMTAPVLQAPTNSGWQMSFMMPAKYQLEDLPRPKDPRVALKAVPPHTVAVIRFSGLWSEQKNQKMAEELRAWVRHLGTYEVISATKFAAYDPPWTLPFLRRNEVILEVKKK